MPPKLSFHPPLLNSASPWATTASDLRALLLCPSTGAVTTRTSLLEGFDHQPEEHRYLFFDAATSRPHPGTSSGPPEDPPPSSSSEITTPVASLNTLGYSPISLIEYLSILKSLPSTTKKTFIISVTGSPPEILRCYDNISGYASSIPFPLAMEINLSCPNIPTCPPPAYSAEILADYLAYLPSDPIFPIGIKTPPFTYFDQFKDLASTLAGDINDPHRPATKLSFITTTNTLGSCLLLQPEGHDHAGEAALGSVGGMAGPPLHPLALGNVATLRRMFDRDPRLAHLDIIGVGGVYDGEGYKRMRRVGAAAVAIATALGRQGVGVFESIEKDINSSW